MIIIVVVVYIAGTVATFSSTSNTSDRYSSSSSSSPPLSHISPSARLVHDDVGWPLSRRKKGIIQIYVLSCLFSLIAHNNVLFVVVCQHVIIIYATCITLSAIRIMYIIIYTCIIVYRLQSDSFDIFRLHRIGNSSCCQVRFLSLSRERCLCTLLQFEGFQINTIIIYRDGRDNYNMKKVSKFYKHLDWITLCI